MLSGPGKHDRSTLFVFMLQVVEGIPQGDAHGMRKGVTALWLIHHHHGDIAQVLNGNQILPMFGIVFAHCLLPVRTHCPVNRGLRFSMKAFAASR